MIHILHEKIGREISSKIDGVLLDSACGGSHVLPLFKSTAKSNKTEFCDVDILILKDNEVKVIIEIEEANIKPTQICGKYLTSALSRYYIYEDKVIPMAKDVLFIQVLDTVKLKPTSSKIAQWKNIEEEIIKIIPIKGSAITRYRLFGLNVKDSMDSAIDEIKAWIK
jgi:hypothetical protein